MCDWKIKRVYDSIKPPVWSPASSPSLSESTLVRWAAFSSFAIAQPSTDRAHGARPHSPPAKLHSGKFGNSAADQICWLDWIMKCDGDHGTMVIIIHHCDTSVWLIGWLSRNKSISCLEWPYKVLCVVNILWFWGFEKICQPSREQGNPGESRPIP